MKGASSVLVPQPWSSITAAFEKAKKRRIAVSAYLGAGADDLLMLEDEDALYVNASEASVKAGQTDPRVLLKLIRAGIRCFSVRRLHAKVYVADSIVFIGSNNASHHSAGVLTELAIRIDDPGVVASVVAWIGGLKAVPLDEPAIKKLISLYKPPAHRERLQQSEKIRRDENTLWITHVGGEIDVPETASYQAWESKSVALVRPARRYELFTIFLKKNKVSRIFDNAEPGDEVIVIDTDEERVYGPMRVVNVVHDEPVGSDVLRVLGLEEDTKQKALSYKKFRTELKKRRIASLAISGFVNREVKNTSTATGMRTFMEEHQAI